MPLTTKKVSYLSRIEPQDDKKIDGTGNALSNLNQALPAQGRADDVVIAVMGSTGTGKSSFIKLLSGDTSIVIGDGLESKTSDIQVICFVDCTTGRSMTIVDTLRTVS